MFCGLSLLTQLFSSAWFIVACFCFHSIVLDWLPALTFDDASGHLLPLRMACFAYVNPFYFIYYDVVLLIYLCLSLAWCCNSIGFWLFHSMFFVFLFKDAAPPLTILSYSCFTVYTYIHFYLIRKWCPNDAQIMSKWCLNVVQMMSKWYLKLMSKKVKEMYWYIKNAKDT